jgi:ABC-2 type transport system ATP-binding protein
VNPSAPALSLRGVRKVYSAAPAPVVAVDGIDLEVGAGEIVAVLGPNGAGKTTTLDMVLGLIAPTEGSVEVLGGTPEAAARGGRVSAVLQSGGLLRDLTVGETVQAMAALHHAQSRVEGVMARAGVTDIAGRKVRQCSGGEQQRLRFALALLPDPQMLVLDEPTAGMDVGARRSFWETMHEETREGRTVLFATHYLEEAQAFAPRTVLIDRGRVLADGPTAELRGIVGDRSVVATVPGAADGALDRLRAVPGVREVHREGDRVTVNGTTSDDVARLLLTEMGGHDLEIAAPTLESAFLTLTGEGEVR